MKSIPTTFKELAFLSDEMEGVVSAFKEEHRETLALAIEVSKLAQETFYRCHDENDNTRFRLSIMLTVRIITNYQAFLVLQMRGLEAEARATLRSLLEAIFVLQANEKNADFSERYARHSINEHRKYLAKLDEIQALGAEYKPDLEALDGFTKADSIPIWKIAKEAGMEQIYVIQYARLCMHTHPSAIGLMDGLRDTNDNRVEVSIAPTDVDADHNLLTGISFMTMALASLDRIYSFGILNELVEIIRREEELWRARINPAL